VGHLFYTRSSARNVVQRVCSGIGRRNAPLLVDGARTHASCERNFAVGDAEATPRALHASECIEMLDPTKTSYVILI